MAQWSVIPQPAMQVQAWELTVTSCGSLNVGLPYTVCMKG